MNKYEESIQLIVDFFNSNSNYYKASYESNIINDYLQITFKLVGKNGVTYNNLTMRFEAWGNINPIDSIEYYKVFLSRLLKFIILAKTNIMELDNKSMLRIIEFKDVLKDKIYE